MEKGLVSTSMTKGRVAKHPSTTSSQRHNWLLGMHQVRHPTTILIPSWCCLAIHLPLLMPQRSQLLHLLPRKASPRTALAPRKASPMTALITQAEEPDYETAAFNALKHREASAKAKAKQRQRQRQRPMPKAKQRLPPSQLS